MVEPQRAGRQQGEEDGGEGAEVYVTINSVSELEKELFQKMYVDLSKRGKNSIVMRDTF